MSGREKDITEPGDLSPAAHYALRRILALFGPRPFSEDDVFRSDLGSLWCRAELRIVIGELRTGGWLTRALRADGSVVHLIMPDRVYTLQEMLYPVPQEGFKPRGDAGPAAARRTETGAGLEAAAEMNPPLQEVLFRALAYIANEGLALTGKGNIHAKQLHRFAGALQVRGAGAEEGWRSLPGVQGEPREAALALDLLLLLGLVSRQPDAYRLEPSALAEWLDLPEGVMVWRLYAAAAERYGAPDTAAHHVRCSFLLAGKQSPDWSGVDGLLDWLCEEGLDGGKDKDSLQKEAGQWLRLLRVFGWCETGHTADGDPVRFRWASEKPALPAFGMIPDFGAPSFRGKDGTEENVGPAGEQGGDGTRGDWFVQSDLAVLVPPGVSFALRWQLAACAELEQGGSWWTFRLSQGALEHASARGWQPAGVIAWLEQHSAGGLPPAVAAALQQWARGIGRTALKEALLLSCTATEEADLLEGHPRLAGFLTRLGPLHFSVSGAEPALVRRILADAGIPALRPAHETSAVPILRAGGPAPGIPPALKLVLPATDASGNGERRGNSLLPPHLRPFSNETDDEGSSNADRSPGPEVPAAWHKEWRKYHASTSRRMMELALELGLKVRLKLADGEGVFIPAASTERPWSVSGSALSTGRLEPLQCRLETGDWEEMQLIYPDKAEIPSYLTAWRYGMIGKST